jgi:single-stranded DNA-binding protein
MPYINAAQISGNLGKDAETMTTQGGRTVTRFSIASTKKWTDKANKTHESTDWFRVAAWGNLTKFASSLKKGDPVLVRPAFLSPSLTYGYLFIPSRHNIGECPPWRLLVLWDYLN